MLWISQLCLVIRTSDLHHMCQCCHVMSVLSCQWQCCHVSSSLQNTQSYIIKVPLLSFVCHFLCWWQLTAYRPEVVSYLVCFSLVGLVTLVTFVASVSPWWWDGWYLHCNVCRDFMDSDMQRTMKLISFLPALLSLVDREVAEFIARWETGPSVSCWVRTHIETTSCITSSQVVVWIVLLFYCKTKTSRKRGICQQFHSQLQPLCSALSWLVYLLPPCLCTHTHTAGPPAITTSVWVAWSPGTAMTLKTMQLWPASQTSSWPPIPWCHCTCLQRWVTQWAHTGMHCSTVVL